PIWRPDGVAIAFGVECQSRPRIARQILNPQITLQHYTELQSVRRKPKVRVCVRRAGLTDFASIAIKPGEPRDAANIGPIDENAVLGNGEFRPACYLEGCEAVDDHKRLSGDPKICRVERLPEQASSACV